MSDRQVAKAIDSAGSSISLAIDAQTKILQAILDFIHPAQAADKFGSAEKDGIDDSVGVYALDEQTKSALKEEWVRLGYPDDFIKRL